MPLQRLARPAARAPRGGYLASVSLLLIMLLAVALVGLGAPGRSAPETVASLPTSASSPSLASRQPTTTPTPRAPRASEPDVRQIVTQYCVLCHNQTSRVAGLALDEVDPGDPAAHPEVWEKVVTKLRTGTMPPAGMPRPDAQTYKEVAEWLEGELDEAWEDNPIPGRITSVHRLNRMQYNNAIRDLLALDVDVRAELPGDETTDGGFDNVANALTISTAHLERYMSVARQVTRLAVGLPPTAPGIQIFPVDDLYNQEERMSDDLPLGSRGGTAVRYNFPADGEYVISVRLQVNYADYFRGMGWAQEIDIRVDGELKGRFTVGGGGKAWTPAPDTYAGAGDGPGWAGAPEWEEYMQFGAQKGLEVRVRVPAGPHVVGVSFPRTAWDAEDILPQQPLRRWGLAEKNSHDYMGFAGVREVQIDGPYAVSGPPADTPSRREIFVCQPRAGSGEEACARQILSRMARRAFRRQPTEADMTMLLDFFRQGRQGGSFDAGIQFALERILVDPAFLLRVYRDPPGTAAQVSSGAQASPAAEEHAPAFGEPYRLGDHEIASRLALFLWSSIPDEQLLDLADRGRLRDRRVLRQQALRMLEDPRATDALVKGFASQWLMLRVIDEKTLDERIYPDYDYNLRDAFRQETELFFASTLDEDRSVLDLLRADYTYVNDRLARHYGIPGVVGGHFRRVALPDLNQRGGLLGQASVLLVSSYPDRTTPVLRGKWLLENILGLEVPEPPANVDTDLQEEDTPVSARPPTIRERLERHRADPTCSSCHNVIDPLGFALESFDAMGGWRTVDERGNPVDNKGAWANGTPVDGFAGLRGLLLGQGDQFARTITAKLMGYGLGRTLDYYDRPQVRKIVRDAEDDDYRWSSIILGIVESPQFLMRSGPAVVTQSQSGR
jgi:hypothetical protein